MKTLDPVSKKYLQIIYKMGYAKIPHLSLDDVRKIFASTFSEEPPDQTIHLQHKDSHLPLHYYYPQSKKIESVILYFHGGGYVIRQFSQAARVCRKLANDTGSCVILIEYSLSPESKFPGAIKEASFVLDWVNENKKSISDDDTVPIFLYGESSGGNLAIATLLYKEHASIAGNILVCPSLDYYQSYSSKVEFSRGYLLDEEIRLWFAHNYLNHESERINPLVSPTMASNLSHIPKTLIISAYFDPLRDEAYSFYQLLRENKVSVDLYEYDSIHTFFNFKIEPYYQIASDKIRKFIKSCK